MLKWSCKKIFAGIVIISLAGNIFPVMPTVSAENLPSYYERSPSEWEKALLLARDFAFEYLKNSSEEPLWKWKYPYISGEKFFYTANDDIPSYVEFKVSTSENPDSGFIIVNLDNNDVQVPIASPSGKTPSEALNIRFDKNHGKSENEKLYYFSPFDQWIVDENGNAETLNPNNQEDEIMEKTENNFKNNSEISLRNTEKENFAEKIFETILTEEWKNKQNAKFAEMKKSAKEFVKNNIQTRWSVQNYQAPKSLANILLPWYNDSWYCRGSLPCYSQFSREVKWKYCYSGCVPVAMAIVMWYYDRDGYNKLLNGTEFAPLYRSWEITQLIRDLWDIMNLECSNKDGVISSDDFHKALKFFNKNWYSFGFNAYKNLSTSGLKKKIKELIDKKKPVMAWIFFKSGATPHLVTIFGYNSKNPEIVRVNLWYWTNDFYVTAYGSNIDFNLNAVNFDGLNWTIKELFVVQ